MKNIEFTDEEWDQVEEYLRDKADDMWRDESYPLHFAYFVSEIIEKQTHE